MKTISKKRTKKKILKKVPTRSGDVLVTQKMLFETKSELKSEITSVRLEVKSLEQKMDARFNHVDARFNQVDARFSQIDARFSEIDARFSEIDSRFSEMDSKITRLDSKVEIVIAAIHRTNALMEDQNSRNRAVLDGYDQIYRRQEEWEKRLKNIEKEA